MNYQEVLKYNKAWYFVTKVEVLNIATIFIHLFPRKLDVKYPPPPPSLRPPRS